MRLDCGKFERRVSGASVYTHVALHVARLRRRLRNWLRSENELAQWRSPELDLLFGRDQDLPPSWCMARGYPLRTVYGSRLTSGRWLNEGTVIRME